MKYCMHSVLHPGCNARMFPRYIGLTGVRSYYPTIYICFLVYFVEYYFLFLMTFCAENFPAALYHGQVRTAIPEPRDVLL